jgi:hypothetical protein
MVAINMKEKKRMNKCFHLVSSMGSLTPVLFTFMPDISFNFHCTCMASMPRCVYHIQNYHVWWLLRWNLFMTDSEYTQSYVIMWLCAWHANSTGISLWRGFIGWCISRVAASVPMVPPLICPEHFPNYFHNKDESLVPCKSFPFFKCSALQNWPREVITILISIPYLWIAINYFRWSLDIT